MDLTTRPSPKVIDCTDQKALSNDAFNKVFSDREPVVLKSFAQHWKMVEVAKQSLTDVAHFIRQLPDPQPQNLVELGKETLGRMFYNDTLTGMNFTVSQNSTRDCINKMLEQTDGQRYAIQCLSIHRHFPDIKSYFPNPLLPDVEPFMWIGNDIRVAAHFDEADNIAVVAAGKRRFTLFPPEQIDNLYIGPLDHTPAGQPISLVDMKTPDMEAHPKYKIAFEHALSVELEEGDAIFIPTPWWHHVESLSSFNVLVNYWWSNNTVSSQLPFPMLLHAIQSLQSMAPEQKAAWQHFLAYYTLGEDGKHAHLPDSAKGILGKPDPQTTQLIQKWLAGQIS